MKELSQKQLVELLDKAIIKFEGNVTQLESAIGMLMVARHLGWKVGYLVHDRRTMKIYESILGINLRDLVPKVGQYAHKSIAWVAMQKVSNFWKVVKGEVTKGEIVGVRSTQVTRR